MGNKKFANGFHVRVVDAKSPDSDGIEALTGRRRK